MRENAVRVVGLMFLVSAATIGAEEAPGVADSRPVWNTSARTPPLMRGTLWWVTHMAYADWSRAQFEEAIQAQRAIGFDVLWILNSPELLRRKESGDAAQRDFLAMIYEIADQKGMHVIADLPRGGWYGQTSADDMISELSGFATRLHARYGGHPSFYGWYLNHEINPIPPDAVEESAFWRRVWKDVSDTCHRLAPGSVVTISPFFLFDEARKRGFVYLNPTQYGEWWCETLKETGIDILMLQDSGEHLAFFTIEQREPFFAAAADACRQAGAQFWVNVETGEADIPDWDTYLRREQEKNVPWRVTPIDWLERKLGLASRYADSIINWGYFPFMDPMPPPGKENPGAKDAYAAYKAYYERCKAAGVTLPPLRSATPH